ncbi:MAG: sulfatase-like hydrolase/transferase, partial [Bacteroidales bacterium]|nr:sulfatase-like hydrolase/transferase [Bacteroidales bacterium]
RLASRGLTYNRFHTAGICSPTRASLLTGRNHHAVATGALVEMASPYPGYVGLIPRSAASVARILRDNGYNTAMFGKDHNVPNEHRSPAGPFDYWPTGRGFEHFYGFVHGDTDQFQPALHLGTEPVDGSGRGEDYILDADLVDRAIEWIHNQQAAAPGKPFFIYQALGTAHAPQQAPAEWIARFRGKFDHGWDVERERTLERQKALGMVPEDTRLAPRPEQIPAWDSLSAQEQKVHARFMEVYAAMLAHQDAQLGRLLDELERMGLADNTLVIYIEGDNGSATEVGIHGSLNELPDITAPRSDRYYDLDWLADNLDVMGGPETYQAIPAGWSLAMNTPFPWVKQVVSHLGGIRNGLVISWPDGMERHGELRSQFHHVIDVVPTILEAANVQPPRTVDGVDQQPIDGTSMVYSFASAAAPPQRDTQYFEVVGNRSIYHQGWFANTIPRNMPWDISRAGTGSDTSTYEWELYNLNEDFSQSRNLAADYPDRLRALQEVFDGEARKYNLYPLQNTGASHRAMLRSAGAGAPRTEYVYWGPNVRAPMGVSPPIFWAPFSVEAEVEIPAGGAEGVIYAAGSHFGGWSFYLHNGRPVAAVSSSAQPGGLHRVTADEPLPPGTHTLVFDVNFAGTGGEVGISLNGDEVARGTVAERPRTIAGGGETYDTGRDTNVAVSPDYEDEGVFTGGIHKVTVRIKRP